MNKDKANGFIGFMSFMVNKSVLYCSSYSKMTVFETLDSESRRKWRHNVAKQLFLFATARRGPRTLLTAKRPAPGTPSCIKCPGFVRGDARGWNWLAHYVSTKKRGCYNRTILKTFSFTSRNEKLVSLNLFFLRVIATQPCTNKLKEIKGPF